MSRQKERCRSSIFSSLMQFLQIALAPRSLLYGYLPEPGSERLLFININADMSAKEHFEITDLNAM